MSYKEYTVRVYLNGSKRWYLNDKLHREDGPAIEFFNGTKEWWLEGKYYRVEEQWKLEISKLKKDPCEGKIVEIEGRKYKLLRV